MCNPNTSPTNDQNPVPEKPPHPPQSQHSNIYLDLISLTNLEEKDVQKPTIINISNKKDNNNNNANNDPPSLFFPTIAEVGRESRSLFTLAFPILLTNLILYSRSMLSMVFLGRIGEVELAAGSLAIAFANITGYSLYAGLALGMEPLCSQAFGANRPKLLSLTLQRCIIFLLVCSLPIALVWLNVSSILGHLHQDLDVGKLAHVYITFRLPDLVVHSFYQPIKIYLRSQGITSPVTYASLVGVLFHVPFMLFLVGYLDLGIAGVAAATSASNLVSLGFLMLQVWLGGLHIPTWSPPSRDCLTGWWPLIRLAVPSCVSVCLEFWWYEIMIIMCGLLPNPTATVASMGVLIQTTGLIYNFPAALSNAVSTRVGNELGAGRPERAKLSGVIGIAWAAAMGLVAMLFASGARNVWAQVFTKDVEILALTTAALPILGLCELGNCPQTAACGVVRGTARPSTAANVNLGAFYVVGTPVAIGLAFFLGVGFRGIWIGLLSAQICCAGLLLYVVGTTDWDDQAKLAQLMTHSGPSSETTATVDAPLLSPDDQEDEEGGNNNKENNKIEVEVEMEPLMSIMVASS